PTAQPAPSLEKSLLAATPVRPPATTRTRTPVSSRHVLWWMEDLAKRVRPPHPCINSTSTASAPGRSRAESAIARTSSGPMRSATSAHSDLDVPEPRWGRTVADAGRLPWLPLPAVRRAPQHPLLGPAHRVAGPPELSGDPSVVGVPVEV